MTLYILLKRDLFENPKHQGYTGIKDLAGTFPLEDFERWGIQIKEKYEPYDREHYALRVELAPEFTNACFHDLAQEHLEKKCAAKDAEIVALREAMQEACDLLAERKYGSPARSPGHNARVALEWALKGGAA